MILEKQNLIPSPFHGSIPNIYVASFDPTTKKHAYTLIKKLRGRGIAAEGDLLGRSFKAQLKYADKNGFSHVLIVGEDEIKRETYPLKDMKTGEQQSYTIDEIMGRLKG